MSPLFYAADAALQILCRASDDISSLFCHQLALEAL